MVSSALRITPSAYRHMMSNLVESMGTTSPGLMAGRIDPAVNVLREHRDAYPSAAELLIEVLECAGRTDEALEECDLAVTRFGGGTLAHYKLNILARADRQQEADAYTTSLLASASALVPEQRIPIRQTLIQNLFRCQGLCCGRAPKPGRPR
jgi:hypothetical protein